MIYVKLLFNLKILLALLFISMNFLSCTPWNLEKKEFPVCNKPEVNITTRISNFSVSFVLLNEKGPIKRALWNFGDGVSLAQLNAGTHTYTSSGTYQVKLQIWNACDEVNTYNFNVTVTAIPTVTTLTNVITTDKTANLSMTVVTNGGVVINRYGICLSSTNSNPTIDNSIINSSNVNPIISSVYSFSFSNLTPNTKYYYRAFAQNAFGTAYGSILTANTIKSCDITAKSTNLNYILQIPLQKQFYQNEYILVTMFSSYDYSFGQAKAVELYDENTLVYSFYGQVLNSNTKTLLLPKDIPNSSCYNIRITTYYNEVYISSTFSINSPL